MRNALRLLLPLAVASCFGPDERLEPAGLVWYSGSTGAFVNDTIRLFAFYRTALYEPIGLPLPSIEWSSSDSNKLRILSDEHAVAVGLGPVLLTGRTRSEPAFRLDVQFLVVPDIAGRLVWISLGGPGRFGGLPRFSEISVRDFPGREVRRVPFFGTPGYSKANPTLTRDRRTIAVTSPNNEWGTNHVTYLVEVDAGTHRLMFDTTGGLYAQEICPVWLPGDTMLAFLAGGVRGGYDIYTARADGTERQRRSAFGTSMPWFDAAPDDDMIFTMHGDLYAWPLDGGEPRPLTNTPTAEEGRPALSPDGQLIAYGRYNEQEGGAVWLMNRDGSEQRRLFRQLPNIQCAGPNWCTYPSSSSDPTWTSNGEYVVLTWCFDPYKRPNVPGYNHPCSLYAVRVADGLAIRLTYTTTGEFQPVMR